MDINKYLNLIPTNNSRCPHYMQYVESILRNMILLGNTNDSLNGESFDITNAAGNQLDIIGRLVGADRILPFVPLTGTREMNDEEFRLVILMKIFRNEWDGTSERAVEIYNSAFKNVADIEFYDDGDCHVTINLRVSGETRFAEILNSSNTLLVPAGVGMTVNVIDSMVSVDFYGCISPVGELLRQDAIIYDDDERMNVGDIEELYVENFEWRYVRFIQK